MYIQGETHRNLLRQIRDHRSYKQKINIGNGPTSHSSHRGLPGHGRGIITSTIAQPHFVSYMGHPSDSQQGGIVAAFTGGAIIGSLMIAYLADRVGRKRTAFISSVISVTGCALQGGAVNIPMMVAGRFIAGVSVGLLSAVVPMYCSELATAQDRGKLSGLVQFMLSWGYFIARWLGYGCIKVNSPFQWRFPLAFQCIPGIILASGVWFLSESPRWLIERERYEEAQAVLEKMHGTGKNQDFLAPESREIRDTIVAEKSIETVAWTAIFTKSSWRKRLLLGAGIHAFGQMSGINVINYYGPQIYKMLGIDTETSCKIIGTSGSLSIIWCTLGLFLLDKVGRIKPIIVATTGCALALLVNSVLSQHYVAGKDTTDTMMSNGNVLRAMVAMNFVFRSYFTMMGIITWVYPAEVFPTRIRARGNSLSTFTNWSLNLVFAQCGPIGLTNMGFKFFYFFFAFNLVALVCYITIYPETKGRTLEQMDQLFGAQVVPHALQDSDAAEEVVAEKLGVRSDISHVEGVEITALVKKQ